MQEIIQTVLGLAIIGVLLYLVDTHIPMDNTIKVLIKVIVVVAAIYWLLNRYF